MLVFDGDIHNYPGFQNLMSLFSCPRRRKIYNFNFFIKLGSHAGHFFYVFVAFSNKIFYKVFFFSGSYTISSIYILVVLVVRNKPYGKRRVISRTKPVYGKLHILD